MANVKPFIGIKRIWYGAPLTEKLTPYKLQTLLKDTSKVTEVLNSHEGTWGYSQDDPSVTEYKNELNGQVYYRDKTDEGAKTITFSMGVFSWKNKVDLQGGDMLDAKGEVTTEESKAVGWASSNNLENINKTIIAQTKTGNYIVFSNGAIVAKGDQQDKNIALGVSAVAMESDSTGVKGEYQFDGNAVDTATAQSQSDKSQAVNTQSTLDKK